MTYRHQFWLIPIHHSPRKGRWICWIPYYYKHETSANKKNVANLLITLLLSTQIFHPQFVPLQFLWKISCIDLLVLNPPLIALLLHLTGNLYSWEKRSLILNLIRFQLGSLASWHHPDVAAGCPAARRPAPPTCQPSRSAQRRGSWNAGTFEPVATRGKPGGNLPTENWHVSRFPMKRDEVFLMVEIVRKIFQPSVFQGISGYFQGH